MPRVQRQADGRSLRNEDGKSPAAPPDAECCCEDPCNYECITIEFEDVDPCPDFYDAGNDWQIDNNGDVNAVFELPLCEHIRIYNNTTGLVQREEWRFRQSFCDVLDKTLTHVGTSTILNFGDVFVVDAQLRYDASLNPQWLFTIGAGISRAKYTCCPFPDLEIDYEYCGETTPPGGGTGGTDLFAAVFHSNAALGGCPTNTMTIFNRVFTSTDLGPRDNVFLDPTVPMIGQDQWEAVTPTVTCDGTGLIFKHANATGIDYTTIVLADAGNTYGIKRMDTSAMVVAAGTAVVHETTGRYSYTFAGGVDGVTYRASFKATHAVSGTVEYFTQDLVFQSQPSVHHWAEMGSATITLHRVPEEYACAEHPDCPACDDADRVWRQARTCDADGTLVNLWMALDGATESVFALNDASGLSEEFLLCYYFDPTPKCLGVSPNIVTVEDLILFSDCPSCSVCIEDCIECDDCDPWCPDDEATFLRITDYEIQSTGECGNCVWSGPTGTDPGCGVCTPCEIDATGHEIGPSCEHPALDQADCIAAGHNWYCSQECIEAEGEEGAAISPCSWLSDEGGTVDLPLVGNTTTTMTFGDSFPLLPGRDLQIEVELNCVTKAYKVTVRIQRTSDIGDGYCSGTQTQNGDCDGCDAGYAIEFEDEELGNVCVGGTGAGLVINGMTIHRTKGCPS